MLDTFIYLSDLLGVTVCAISGVLIGTKLRMDPFGLLVLGGITGIGGGSIRDMLMGATPVFWLMDITYIYVIIITVCSATIWLNQVHRFPAYLLPTFDAFGLAIFTIIGTQKALRLGFSLEIAIVMGCITGVGGGMLRDILSGQIPFVLKKEIYATASIFGATLYVIGFHFGLESILTMSIAMVGTLVLRLSALYWHLSLPVFDKKKED